MPDEKNPANPDASAIMAPIAHSLLRHFRGVPGPSGLRKVGFNPVGSKYLPCLIDQLAPPVTAVPGIRVMDQKSVLDECIHNFRVSTNDYCN